MRIAVVNNTVPFLAGGAEHLAHALTAKLNEFGHEAHSVRIPFSWEPPSRIVDSMLACRLLRLPKVDRVIALKFPAYYVPHENKVLWLLHQFRQAYDLWGTDLQGLPSTPDGTAIRDAVREADNVHLRNVRKIFTNSRVTSDRLQSFNGIDSEVLWPPLLSTSHLSCQSFEDFVFYPSRVNAAKRQLLAVESMRHVKVPGRLILAGKGEDPAEDARIDSAIRRHNLEDRVVWERTFISEERKADYLSRAAGTLYIPYDEDSYGYVTLESYFSRKPVITCSDSGGTDVLVKDGVTGLVASPDPAGIAAQIEKVLGDRSKARAMGQAGYELVQAMNITWDHVVRRLTE
ncbi:MAG: glycosyltransferase family 4 protein [Bryobacteraceae bacterium]